MSSALHRRIQISPQVLGFFPEGRSVFFCMDHWVKGDRHSIFIQTYDPIRFDKGLESIASCLATSALMSSSLYIQAPNLQKVNWHFVIERKNGESAWFRAKFKSVYPEKISQVKRFPEANDILLFDSPSFCWISAPRKTDAAAISDRHQSPYHYRRGYIEATQILANLVDQMHGGQLEIRRWNPPKGRGIDSDWLTLTKANIELRTLFVRRSKKILADELKNAQEECQDYKVLMPITALENGFHGAVLTKNEISESEWTGNLEDGPAWDKDVFKEDRETKPTWQGAWKTRVHASGYLG